MKQLLHAFLIVGLSACEDSDAGRTTRAIPIILANVPEQAVTGSVGEIAVTAQAPNGCYGDPTVVLTERAERHFEIKATARIIGSGACPDVLIVEDTVLNVAFPAPGSYYFQTHRGTEIQYDTVIVSD
jgi:hypothetical protein